MNRLQKKCLVASGGIHLLLALVLFIGPGFLSAKPKEEDLPVLDFVPVKTVDELISGGGNPKANPAPVLPVPPQPQPAPPAPAPQPEPVKTREPDPPKQVDPPKPEEDSLVPRESKRPKVEISKTLVTRTHDAAPDKRVKEEAQARAQAKAVADARRRLARQLGQMADNMGSELSGGTTVELKGPGGGGLPYANWRQSLKTIYENAWLLPDNVIDNDATTAALVTVAHDGTVLSCRITQRSGDNVVDHSVQAALDRVPRVPALPDSAKEDKRTVTINFSVRAKRGLG